jgi:hypothetical protein
MSRRKASEAPSEKDDQGVCVHVWVCGCVGELVIIACMCKCVCACVCMCVHVCECLRGGPSFILITLELYP